MSTSEERARAVTLKLLGRPDGYNPEYLTPIELEWFALKWPLLVDALQAEWAAAMEETAKYLEENKRMPQHIGPLWNAGWTEAAIAFASWCRAKAKEAQP